MSGIAPGWYKDPADPATQRYWDGEGWLGEPLLADVTPPDEPPSPAPPPAPEPPPLPVPAQPPLAPEQVDPAPPQPPEPNGVGWPPGHGPPPPPGWPPYPMGMPVPAPMPHGLPLAPLGTRLLARLIDIGLVLLLNVVVNGWFVVEYLREALPASEAASRRIMEGGSLFDGNTQPSGRAQWLEVVILLLATALWFAYEVPALANNGQTIGKRLLGIRVMRLESTEPLGFGRAFRRWRPLGLPTLLWICCVGFILQFIDSVYAAIDRPLHQALHDKSARTVVVYAPRSTAAPTPPPADSDPPGGTP